MHKFFEAGKLDSTGTFFYEKGFIKSLKPKENSKSSIFMWNHILPYEITKAMWNHKSNVKSQNETGNHS